MGNGSGGGGIFAVSVTALYLTLVFCYGLGLNVLVGGFMSWHCRRQALQLTCESLTLDDENRESEIQQQIQQLHSLARAWRLSMIPLVGPWLALERGCSV